MKKKEISFKFSAVALAVLLAGCGGGGYYDNKATDSNPGNNTTNPSTGETVQNVNASAITLTDVNGVQTPVINIDGAKATVKVTDQSGQGISGAVVTFTTTGDVILGSSNGAVLTDAAGDASISLVPSNPSLTGVYKVSASVEYGDKTITTKDLAFTLQPLNVVLANMVPSTDQLEVGGSTNITLKTQTDSGNFQNNVVVNFTATCGTFTPASVTSLNQGDITTTYKAISVTGELCQGQPIIYAKSSNSQSTPQVTVKVAPIAADSLVYTTTSAVDLGIAGSGSAASGQVEFTLFANGRPAPNQEVLVQLTEAPPDLNFISLDNNKLEKLIKSDSNGKIIVNLYPGDIPGPVEIKAALASDPKVYALSKNVKVSTGRVTQNGVSLSVSKQSLRTDIDGDTSTITARLTDRVGNDVPEGTVISFVAEGGKVDSSCATNKAGSCSVTLTTQNPRPVNNRVTVLAFVEGDKAYNDLDGSNSFTKGDTLTHNIGAFFRDDNEDNLHNLGEFIYSKANAGLKCALSSFEQPNIPNTCDSGLSAVLRQQLVFAFAHDTPTFVWKSGFESNGKISKGTGTFSFNVYGNSLKTVPMPSSTTVGVSVKDNTTFEPSVKLIAVPSDSTKKVLSVTGAEPYSTLNITLADKDYAIVISGSGTGTSVPLDAAITGTPQFNYKNQTCEAEVINGDETVPNTMALLTPTTFANIAPVVRYTVRLKGCAQGDDIKVITSVPNGKTQTSWLELK
ncbi:hypothetical protein IF090_08660 [Acinetobacter towneri]|uniref:hypothetical protein n=1 Tax=Acinetobacter towneri TaxID=202956 RepID=UPI001CE0CAB6|nr:hypothetical protein [Acinetobacter towneri]MCA4779700.1 hypothetical protein [Acinetobacter towneri]MCA4784861.1 hypothetical protein [Acinetobacter towneri]MCA4788131.1 hypothetical protein [Acinetobacter towneri]MCA4796105.1 hypothetical protein [Acinetobacter towneri]MCA4801316.1 hypothetical protein [Acinetobacter towneri]